MGQDLSLPTYMRLGLVEKIRFHLLMLLSSKEYRESLDVPDRSRKIFDTANKIEALQILDNEIEDLANSIFKELRPDKIVYDPSIITNKPIYSMMG